MRRAHEGDPAATAPAAGGAVEQELVMYLERDQLTADTAVPVPRRRFDRRLEAALWALRVFVVVIGAMVVYTFAASLR